MVEIWKDIRGYENLYEASNWGRIRSMWFGKIKILKPIKIKNGYLQVDLSKDGKTKIFLVHRLVYEAFNGLIPEGMQVNHINEIKTDNSLWNLNLMTRKENINWGSGNQRRKKNNVNNPKLSDPVLQLTLDYELINEWPSMTEAARNGFSESKICECCNGKRKSHRGFKWVKKINYKMVG